MRIALCGALGKMGREVYEYCQNLNDIEVVSLVDKRFDGADLYKGTPQNQRLSDAENYVESQYENADFNCQQKDIETVCDIENAQSDFDAIIDFSSHDATISILKAAIVRRCAVVLATTGHTEEEKKYIEYASRFIPLFYSNNMSLGIAVLAKSVKETLTLFKKADVEIVETHHVEKLDVPSGTALMLAGVVKDAIGGQIVVGRHKNGKKQDGDIGVHSLRMGSVFGQHEVRINTGEEAMVFTHEALSRKVYAKGAIEAVRYLKNQTAGLYETEDLL